MAKIITAREAAQLIPDGATVACGDTRAGRHLS